MIYKSNVRIHPSKALYSPDLYFECKRLGISFFYSYIRKNASTSFKYLFQALYPDKWCGTDNPPNIATLNKYLRVTDRSPEDINMSFKNKVFVYRDPIDRVFSVYKNKLIQQDGAEDLLMLLENVLCRDPMLLTFDEFVNEYVVLLETDRWEDVDGHLYPQVWHLLPINYNKVIRLENVYKEMQDLLPANLCDQVFKEPSNSTTKGSVPLPGADPDCPAVYFRKKYLQNKALPTLNQLMSPDTKQRLLEIYAEDYQMIAEVESSTLAPMILNHTSFDLQPERVLGLDFSIPD